MTIAGESAATEALRQRHRADAHEAAARDARARAARFEIAHRTEVRTAQVLAPLAAIGYHLLPDRRWPGSRTAQVDLVVVGPGGVFIVDTKAWRDVSIAGGRIARGQEDVTDDIARLADLRYGTEAALAEVGLAPTEVHAIAALAGQRGMDATVASVRIRGVDDLIGHITSFGARLTGERVDIVLRACMEHFPPMDGEHADGANPDGEHKREEHAPDLTLPRTVLPRATPAAATSQAAADPTTRPAPEGDPSLQADLLAGMLQAPIEDWMAFLDPAQAKLVRRNFNGPARIRGAAGTGKTVVGLHRAAYLARTTGQRVLFATYVRTLPRVLGNLLERLAPDVRERVHFVGINAFALQVLKERHVPAPLNGLEADQAFRRVWNAVDASSPLRSARFTERYWREEIRHVIKGRGLTEFAQYAELARVGRKHPLTIDQRQAVWDLHSAYDAELRRRRVIDHEDVVLLARDSLRANPLERYGAVIVDEAQDLSCAMISMLHSLVGDRPDGLTLIGDGQQTIYPGGYTLGEVGVSVAGRGVVLDVNHRNTAEILSFATDLVSADSYVDIEGVDGAGDAVSSVPRSGAVPVVSTFASWSLHDAALVAHVRSVLTLVGTGPGDIGVLARTNADVDRLIELLRGAGLPVIPLTEYTGRTVEAIKVGTIKRAKGLEFKQVLVGRVRAGLLGAESASGAEHERWTLDRRELYVGMTRARDGLWVGVR